MKRKQKNLTADEWLTLILGFVIAVLVLAS
jgi:hypothetical protein